MLNIYLRTYKSGKRAWQAEDATPGFPRVTKTFAFDEKRAAKAWCLRMAFERQRGARFDPAQADCMTLGSAIERYVAVRTIRKLGAKQEKELAARWLQHPLAARPLTKVIPLDLDAYVSDRLAEGRAGSTVLSELSFISEVYNFVRRKLQMHSVINPVLDVDKPERAKSRTRRLSAQELADLMQHLSSCGNPEMFYVFSVAMETGLRKGELLRLRWEDITFDARIARVEQARKGRHPKTVDKYRVVVLTGQAVTLLAGFRASRGAPKSGTVFSVSSNAIDMARKKALRATGIKDWRFHDCRHEAASRWISEKKVPLEMVRQQLGHRNLSTTQKYTHFTQEEMTAAIA